MFGQVFPSERILPREASSRKRAECQNEDMSAGVSRRTSAQAHDEETLQAAEELWYRHCFVSSPLVSLPRISGADCDSCRLSQPQSSRNNLAHPSQPLNHSGSSLLSLNHRFRTQSAAPSRTEPQPLRSSNHPVSWGLAMPVCAAWMLDALTQWRRQNGRPDLQTDSLDVQEGV